MLVKVCMIKILQSICDLNRSGVALMEIVSEPDIRTPDEAGMYISKSDQF